MLQTARTVAVLLPLVCLRRTVVLVRTRRKDVTRRVVVTSTKTSLRRTGRLTAALNALKHKPLPPLKSRMDGFDDLLAPSRRALEQNPFADPFPKRSNSPDPWASFHQPSSSSAFNDHVHDVFGGPSNTSAILEDSHANVFRGVSSSGGVQNYSTSEEPLAAEEPLGVVAEESHEEVHEPEPQATSLPIGSLSPRSPGFRESIPTTIEDTLTSVPVPEPSQPPLVESLRRSESPIPLTRHAPAPLIPSSTLDITTSESPLPSPSPVTFGRSEESISSSQASTTSVTSSSAVPTSTAPKPISTVSATSPSSAFYSPLDKPKPIGLGLESSFAGLALGGESIGGWQGTQSNFIGVGGENNTGTSAGVIANIVEEESESDDDKPILQTRAAAQLHAGSLPSTSSTPSKTVQKGANGISPVFAITVDDPQRVGDPIRAYTMYTVHTKTTSPLFSKSSFSVLRRYSDFRWIYETLSLNNPGVVVPPVPEKNTFGRFDANFVEQRRSALEKCIRKIANHPVLQKDADLKLFLESDSFALDIKHRKAEIAHEKGGLMATIGQTIAGPRFYESDEWFDKQKGYLDSLELQLRGLVKTIDLVSKQRAELSIATFEFAQTLQDLSASDVGKQLSSALAGLAEVERKAQEIQERQAQEDVNTILSTADEYARLINSVRLAFSSRIRTYHAWQNADANVKKVKQAHEASKSQGRLPSDQLGRSLAYVAEAERRALDAKQEFEQVSRLVKSEVARFERERIEDFKNSLEAFLGGMISRQKELIIQWEAFQQTLLKRVGQGPVGRGPVPANTAVAVA